MTSYNITIPLVSAVSSTATPASPPQWRSLASPPGNSGDISDGWMGPFSPEYINFGFALLVYAVRYAAVFWKTNKTFSVLFSFQLLVSAAQNLMAFPGFSVLYKIQVVGAEKVLHRHEPFLLDKHVTLLLYIMSTILVWASSGILYMYGYHKYTAFICQQSDRHIIMARGQQGSRAAGWSYFSHCAALCVLVAVGVCCGPLLYDYTVVYRGSLDTAVLACVIAGMMHLFLWVVVWLMLTVKQRWIFKLRVPIGHAAVRSAKSVKLVTDVSLAGTNSDCGTTATSPLLVVGGGRTYTVTETSPKKAIMSVIQKASLERRGISNSSSVGSSSSSRQDEDEQVYWLRPKPPSPKTSPDSEKMSWLSRRRASPAPKHKVTFDDSLSSSSGRKGQSLASKSPRGAGKRKGSHKNMDNSDSEDDGDYATLREMPLGSLPEETDILDEENKACVETTPLRGILRADSGMPHDDVTPRSESSPEQGGSQSESSSGVHSNSSGQARRSSSMEELMGPPKLQPQWRSFSLQRNVQPPGSEDPSGRPNIVVVNNSTYGLMQHPQYYHTPSTVESTHPVPIYEAAEQTVVIRRKQNRPKTEDLSKADEPFERSTNMRMTSFTDNPDNGMPITTSSNTLPMPSTSTYTNNCVNDKLATMPLPGSSHNSPHHVLMNVVVDPASGLRQGSPVFPSNSSSAYSSPARGSPDSGLSGLANSFPRHATIPTNGIRAASGTYCFGKRFGVNSHLVKPGIIAGGSDLTVAYAATQHHTFPHAAGKYHQLLQDRDSANYSMTSSGDSDNYLSHT